MEYDKTRGSLGPVWECFLKIVLRKSYFLRIGTIFFIGFVWGKNRITFSGWALNRNN